jgi:hypothetical protein
MLKVNGCVASPTISRLSKKQSQPALKKLRRIAMQHHDLYWANDGRSD